VGIRCLVTDDALEARAIASELDRLNRERREVESVMQDEALADLDAATDEAAKAGGTALCLYRPTWHQGVVGIVASRLKDRFHRPAIVFAPGSAGELRGSGRSIKGFHLRDALDLVSKREHGLILRFGGHAFAAGLTIAEASFERFAAAFEKVAAEHLTPADLERVVETDGTLGPGELSAALARRLAATAWGQGFPAPTFDDRFDVVDSRIVGGAHTRATLARGNERFNAIAFRHTDALPARVRAVFRPEIDAYGGAEALQLVLAHWEPA